MNLENIKQLDIIFENVESIIVPPKHITNLIISEPYEVIFGNSPFQVSDYIEIGLQDIHLLSSENLHFPDDSIAEKRLINSNDISCIEIIDDDNKSQTIYVNWHDEDEYINLNQHITHNDNKLNILITKIE